MMVIGKLIELSISSSNNSGLSYFCFRLINCNFFFLFCDFIVVVCKIINYPIFLYLSFYCTIYALIDFPNMVTIWKLNYIFELDTTLICIC